MNRILGNLFLGDTTDAIRFSFPMEPLQGTLDLTGWDVEMEIRHNAFQTINHAISIIEEYTSRGCPLLVFCHAGMDRSPFIVACYLAEHFDFTPEAAYDLVKKERPQTIIHDDWMRLYQSSLGKAINDG